MKGRPASRRFFPFVAVCLVALAAGLCPGLLAAASRPAVRGSGGAVASEHPEATRVGLQALAAGGNAVDAAVATALALAVVYPEAGNLGGGGFAVVKMGELLASLDFRETAPAAATAGMFLDAAGKPIVEASLVGPLASGVPGSPSGLFELHRRFGRLPWKEVVAPAQRLAEEGFIVDSHLVTVLADDAKLLARFPETAATWLPGGAPPPVGGTLRQPDLADTLAAYAEEGPAAITTGPVAAAVEAAAKRWGGVLTAGDLAAYQPVWREPLHFQVFGWQAASMSLPSSGGVILAQAAAQLEALGWRDLPRFGARRAHLLIEVLRQVYADRYFLGDPSTTEVQPADLLSSAALAERRARIRSDRVTPSASLMPALASAESDETTHLSVADGQGNLVALTTTLNGLFGCGLYVPGAGFFLNNEMDDFAVAPGQANLFGLIQGAANQVRPGKRMLSSMSPVIAWRTDGGLDAVALGGRGGSRIPTNSLQVLLNVLVDGDPLQTALDRPRLHHQWLPDAAQAEPDALSPETRAALEALGHVIEISPRAAKVQAVRRLPDGKLEAATDPRVAASGGVVLPDL